MKKLRGWRSATLFLTLLVLSFGVGTSWSSPAAAQDEPDIAAIDLQALRSFTGASTVPYEVTVVSDRAIEGTLQIRLVEQNLSFEFPLALAANTEISQLVAIPVENDFIGEITVNLIADGTSVADIREFGGEGNLGTDFAAGVLGLEVNAEQAQVTPPIGMTTNIEIDDLRILSALDIVVTSPAALRTLTVEEQSQLFTWVGSGGQLAIADDAGTIDELLPAEWSTGESRVSAGVGEINFVGTDWEQALPPPVSSSNSGGFLGEFGVSTSALASDAGFQVPSIGLLSLVLLGYLLIIGPVTFTVLAKMNRQTLAWLAIPALAVLFGMLIVGAGRVLISGRNDAYATVVTVTPAGSEIASTLLISDDGRQTIDLPAGWSARGNGGGQQFGFGGGGAGSDLVISPSRTTTELAFDIDTGSAAVVRVEGRTADTDLPFAFTDLEVSNGDLTGTLTNQTGVDLSDVAVFVGSNAMHVDSLSAGETLAFDVEMQPANRIAFAETREWGVRMDFGAFGPFEEPGFGGFDEPEPDDDGSVNGAAWMRWRLDNYGAAVPDGVITAVGWSRDLEEYSLVGGEGRTALVQYADLPASNELTSGQVRRTIPRAATWQDIEGFGRDFGEGVPLEYIRPDGSDAAELALETSAELEELAIFVDGEWRYIDLASNPDARTVSIPEEAWTNDRLTAVFGFAGFGFNGNTDAFQPRFVEVDNDTVAGVLLPAGERSTRQVQFEDEFGPGGFGDEMGEEFIGLESEVERESRQDLDFESTGILEGTYDTWSLLVEPGDEVTVTMRSNQLDSLLIVNTEDGDFVAENDDGPNLGLDSQVQFNVDDWEVYVIETRPLFGPEFGEYTVFIEVESAEASSFVWSAEGDFEAGDIDAWPVRLTAGQTATVTSEDLTQVSWLDADGVGLEAEIGADGAWTITVDADGSYILEVSGEPGSYGFELAVEDG